MAYKDEYEVARLHLDAAERAKLRAEFGEDAQLWFHLHPPLRALGMKRNLKLGEWMIPVFRGLRAGKRLRGTSLDPFGRAQVRRVERELIGEYERRVRDALENLTPVTHPAVAELAELPDVIRGTRTSSSATWSATGHAPQSCAGGSPAARPSPPPRSGRSCRSPPVRG
jgi:indolepyruvate ferredoxin oxidoreductase